VDGASTANRECYVGVSDSRGEETRRGDVYGWRERAMGIAKEQKGGGCLESAMQRREKVLDDGMGSIAAAKHASTSHFGLAYASIPTCTESLPARLQHSYTTVFPGMLCIAQDLQSQHVTIS
jgi:hypothetical protein